MAPRGPDATPFKRPMHPFVRPILLGAAGVDPLVLDAEAHPPDIEL